MSFSYLQLGRQLAKLGSLSRPASPKDHSRCLEDMQTPASSGNTDLMALQLPPASRRAEFQPLLVHAQKLALLPLTKQLPLPGLTCSSFAELSSVGQKVAQ